MKILSSFSVVNYFYIVFYNFPIAFFQGYHRLANDEEKKIFLRVREKSGNVILSQGKLGFSLKRFQLLFRLD